MKGNSFNAQVFLETACYAAFATLMLYLTISGKYLTYIAPRMKPYLYFTAIVMIAWAFSGLRRLYRPQHILRSLHCLVLVVPILLFLLPHKPLGASSVSTAYTGGSAIPGVTGNGIAGSSTAQDAATETEDSAIADTPAQGEDETPLFAPTALPGLNVAEKRIDIPNESFYEWMEELFTNMAAYEGYTVSMTGFVLKDPENFGENEFVPARLAMTCCVADLVPIGMMCVYDDVDSLEEEAWVTVEGELFQGTYMGGVEPQIRVTKVTPAEAVEEYVYAY